MALGVILTLFDRTRSSSAAPVDNPIHRGRNGVSNACSKESIRQRLPGRGNVSPVIVTITISVLAVPPVATERFPTSRDLGNGILVEEVETHSCTRFADLGVSNC